MAYALVLSLGLCRALVAIILGTVPWIRSLNPFLLLALWPTAVFGMADPEEVWLKLILLTLVFGGNFVLYGVLGLLLGLCFQRKPKLPKKLDLFPHT
jgi:hypothetical protein